MHDQPKFFPQRGTSFYADGRSVRPQVENTVARSQAHPDSYFATGLVDGKEGDGLPFPVTAAVLERGQERYNVYCTPCHSRVGNGEGMIVQRGYSKAGNFHTARLRTAPLGHFFHVISSGYGSMPDYAAQVTPADRWAIVAYIRALQLSQNAQTADVPAGKRIEPLKAIAESEGLPESFAAEPTLPATAATGTPDGKLFVLPTAGESPAPAAAKPTTTGAATQQ
jgi:mono/diheme cytochrome c family protein